MDTKTLVFIDDDQDEHMLVREAFNTCGDLPRLSGYLSARLAFNELKVMSPLPDLIVVDINMPVMSGIEFLEELRKHRHLRCIPVIVHSTTGEASTRKTCEKLGAALFLKKAQNFDDLISAVRKLLAVGTPSV